MSILSNFNAEQFESATLEDMTLLHHVAFDGNVEVLKLLTALPYYRDIVDSNSNEVTKNHYWLILFSSDGHPCYGLRLGPTVKWSRH